MFSLSCPRSATPSEYRGRHPGCQGQRIYVDGGIPAVQEAAKIYRHIEQKKGVGNFDVGLHVKTAGTTRLEELIRLAKSGQDGLNIAKEVYCKSLDRMDELKGRMFGLFKPWSKCIGLLFAR